MMPAGPERLLDPAKSRFVYGSLLVAMIMQMSLLFICGRNGFWAPDIFLLVLLFWTLNQSQDVAFGTALLGGACADVYYYSSLLGQHMLAYTCAVATTLYLQRRLIQFNPAGQMMQMALILAMAQGVLLLVSMIPGGAWPGWLVFVKPILETALWPLAAWLLQAPQRRTPSPDSPRPL